MSPRLKSLNPFIDQLQKTFDTRLVGILGYGSFFDTKISEPEDVDLVIVLSDPKPNDLIFIKNSYNLCLLKQRIQAQIIYLEEIFLDGSYYSLNTTGTFFLQILQEGVQTLYGKNIFHSVLRAGKLAARISLLQKIQQYAYQLNNFYLNFNYERDGKTIHHFMIKKIPCLELDTKLFFSYKNAFTELISKSDKKVLEKIRLKQKSTTQTDLLSYIRIVKKIHLLMINKIKDDHDCETINFGRPLRERAPTFSDPAIRTAPSATD